MNQASTHTSPAQRLPELPPARLAQCRVLVMSDRLPMGDRAHGGLAAALSPVLRERRGVWIGWPGVAEEEAPDPQVLAGQTPRDLQNFLDCAQALAGHRDIRAGAFPIGVDFHGVAERAASPEIEAAAARLREQHGGRSLVLGIDRLDRSKGIPEKLRAFAELLARRPELHGRVSLIQVVVPSREDLPRYRELGCEIARQVGEINGRFSRPGWIPVHFLQRTLTPDELLAHYRAADVALITPLREGMNLVAKEYCAARVDEQGALVLSEFAGAASQLAPGALLVNPHNATSTARTLHKALRMTEGISEGDRGRRMRSLREEVRRHDIFWWAKSFLARALDEGPERTLRLERTLR